MANLTFYHIISNSVSDFFQCSRQPVIVLTATDCNAHILKPLHALFQAAVLDEESFSRSMLDREEDVNVCLTSHMMKGASDGTGRRYGTVHNSLKNLCLSSLTLLQDTL